jgi:hypothetical protein
MGVSQQSRAGSECKDGDQQGAQVADAARTGSTPTKANHEDQDQRDGNESQEEIHFWLLLGVMFEA